VRRAAIPLTWYYAVTLGIPLANGAANNGAAFQEHALVVVVLPLALVAAASTLRNVWRGLRLR
jgi:hypothetical protein